MVILVLSIASVITGQLIGERNLRRYATQHVYEPNDEIETEPLTRLTRYLGDNNIICEIAVAKGDLTQDGYQVYPTAYINKTCVGSRADPFLIESNGERKPEVCLHNDNEFGCQTLYEELNVLKKSLRNPHTCWEHTTQLVAVGCKCNIHFKY